MLRHTTSILRTRRSEAALAIAERGRRAAVFRGLAEFHVFNDFDGSLPDAIESGFDGAISKAVFAPEKWAAVARGLVGGGGWVATYSSEGAEPSASARVAKYALADRRNRLV